MISLSLAPVRHFAPARHCGGFAAHLRSLERGGASRRAVETLTIRIGSYVFRGTGSLA
jgi:hypothetical protein